MGKLKRLFLLSLSKIVLNVNVQNIPTEINFETEINFNTARPNYMFPTKKTYIFKYKNIDRVKVKRRKKIQHETSMYKKAGMATLI